MFGKTEQAISNWEIVLTKDPNNLGVLNNLSLCLARASEKNVPRALELINRAINLSPTNAELLDTLGDILIIAKRHQEAIGKYELAVRNDKSRIDTRKKLVTAYRLAGMDGQAETTSSVIQEMERAVKANEESKERGKTPVK